MFPWWRSIRDLDRLSSGLANGVQRAVNEDKLSLLLIRINNGLGFVPITMNYLVVWWINHHATYVIGYVPLGRQVLLRRTYRPTVVTIAIRDDFESHLPAIG